MANKMIVLMTDFGNDVYTGQMKGVIKTINPYAEIVDLTHEIQPQNLLQAALIISSSFKFFPKNSIFVCVVDPEVGSNRDIILVSTDKYIFIAPNNGILTMVLAEIRKYDVYKVVNRKFFLKPVSYTFHGRDIFAPVAAFLSRGIPIDKICKKYNRSKLVRIKQIKPVCKKLNNKRVYIGKYISHDRFGNIMTNLSLKGINKVKYHKMILKVFFKNIEVNTVEIKKYYAQVKEKEMIAYFNSFGFVELAINKGNVFEKLTSQYGDVKQLKFCLCV